MSIMKVGNKGRASYNVGPTCVTIFARDCNIHKHNNREPQHDNVWEITQEIDTCTDRNLRQGISYMCPDDGGNPCPGC